MAVAPNSSVITGPNFQPVDASAMLVTPTGLTQLAVADALTGAGFLVTPTGGVQKTLADAVATTVGNALTAVGTNRATALALTATVNNITTATASTGVTLPSAATVGIGARLTIFNAGASPIQVYGAGSDTIDTVAGVTGVPLTNAKRAVFYVVAAATWISAQLGVVSA